MAKTGEQQVARGRTKARPSGRDKRLATEARLAEGKELRKAVPREEHAGWLAPGDRPDPVDVLEEQDATRQPDLVPIRHGRMLVSPFTFFRGAAAIMAWDLAHTPTTSLTVQACGDAHLMNFGVFAAPDRQLVFDVNDFDETLPAPFEWDLKRLAASFAIAARDNGFVGRDQRAAAREAVSEYQRMMAAFVKMPFLDVWYTRVDVERLLDLLAPTAGKKGLSQARKDIAKAQSKTSLGALKRFAAKVDGAFRIKPDPPVVVPIPRDQLSATEPLIRQAFEDYGATLSPERRIVLSRYHFADFARKVVGVGSVGTEAYMLLLMGERDDDPLFLQLKEAEESVLAPFAGASEYDQDGERVVQGQRIMQAASDSFLGWLTVSGKDFYVRQLRDMKGSADVAALHPKGLGDYARVCGATLARAHARSGQVGELSGYIGKGAPFARAIEEFAVAYADQNELDYQALLDAERDGRISVERGV